MQIRPFAGTLRDAQGLIEVDAETFDECPYTPDQLVELLARPEHWTAVAVERGQVVGFVSAFETQSLAGCRWEIDELAVRPTYQGRGVGTRLVAAATKRGAALGLPQARAWVAATNAASRRAFEKVAFRAQRPVDLLLYEVGGRVPRPAREGTVAVREAGPDDATAIAAHGGYALAHVARLIDRPGNVYLVAAGQGRVIGCAELIEVHTLQYRGFWLESMAGRSGPGRLSISDARTGKALASEAIEAAKRRPWLELVGRPVSPADVVDYRCLVSEGFRRIDEYHVYLHSLQDPWYP
jgi:ribosomal protein S18 acetylase RimI-like enzyme